ncbi:MAG: hypothetical protein ACYTG6_00140, partial [Planctomycetota bacterium]
VAEAIERGVERLRTLQAESGHWGNPEDRHAMGHTALPLLAVLKGGMDPTAETVQRAFAALRTMEMTSTYGVGCYLMAIQARYAPKVDTWDVDVGSLRRNQPDPEDIRARLSDEDEAALIAGVAYLVRAQAANGLWRYHVQEGDNPRDHDLSNVQYALLGLRAAADSGIQVPTAVWREALRGLFTLQEAEGPHARLIDFRIDGPYAFRRDERARVRGFRYRLALSDGPLGERTVHAHEPTGSMTTAGVSCVKICSEALWRSRRFRGKDRKMATRAVRDGLAWLQEHFSVTDNPGAAGKHHFYYLYGLERAGMLTARRWIGEHDWYKEGADVLLAHERERRNFGGHVATSFAVLFLKRATRPPPQVTGG